MIDHVGFKVGNFAVSRKFYEATLASLGYKVRYADDKIQVVGLGEEGGSSVWLSGGGPQAPVHLAFTTADRASVKRFYDAAIAAGGRDNGKPGLRAEYHPNYYGAFVLDPDGHNIEAVCHKPE
jgi:catechol 2,3-dioxygenase-like lactoylglutathione lyase family enzyme